MPGDGPTIPLAVVGIGSAVVLVRTAILCDKLPECKDYNAWVLSCGVLGFVIALVCLLLLKFKPGTIDGVVGWIGLFLTLLWIAGTGCATFERPYKVTGNGYFGCWMALVGSWILMLEIPALKSLFDQGTGQLQKRGGRWFAGLFLASALVMVQVAVDCDNMHHCEDEVAWVLACSVISLVICIVVLVLVGIGNGDVISDDIWKWFSIFLFLWWCAGCGVATYDIPYTTTGNGYFGCWAALISAAMLMVQAWGLAGQAEAEAEKAGKEILGVCVFSLACLIAAAKLCDEMHACEDYYAWAVACSALGFIISLIVIVCVKFNVGADAIRQYMWVIAVLLVLLWTPGVATMTFEAPFKHTGNGYFGAWLATIFSWILMLKTLPKVKQVLMEIGHNGAEICMALLGGLALWIQAAWDCDKYGSCKDHLAWALACGLIGFILTALFIVLYDKLSQYKLYIFFFLALLYGFGVGVITFDAPYTHTGNGYFAVWVAFIGAVLLFWREFSGSGGGGGGGGGGSNPLDNIAAGGGTTEGEPAHDPGAMAEDEKKQPVDGES